MTLKEELKKVKYDRERDAEWLAKYKRIVDGIHEIAQLNADYANENMDEWIAVASGLACLSKLMKEDLDSRKENAQ